MNWQHIAETLVCSAIGSFIGASVGWIWAGPRLQAVWWDRAAQHSLKRAVKGQLKRDLQDVKRRL